MKHLKALWLTLQDDNIQTMLFFVYVLTGGLWFPFDPSTDDAIFSYILKSVVVAFLSIVAIVIAIALWQSIKYTSYVYRRNYEAQTHPDYQTIR